ncbi:bacillithiol biosynthesis cysteine-adding enzyme BshC [Bacillus sp. EB106-08-02-XG196]|uniref:bacillithiol biosynthesis cysteine-adding enzyme BshC n=1 Tax=Bacillus sp. EB106-08-02-XG196 TaxID=2737049 RepID=UPI0015C49172|nr:bacillithiol biosynthesis cysteine-adding enzyme BshC [Bacillus sp. EB106-08-02-XG196]NWQ43925.1 bacillithiol biosynthesis cysteine-adding enzyme BshC [Bacillus sp. EB106-08-02-XG196]
MEILDLSLSATNRFASNYLEQSPDILSFFHYRFNDFGEDQKRLDELSNRSFPREEVADHIEKFMERFPTSEAVNNSLAKLKQLNSVVVIGGQQAGILTGPLYSIHKIISIIKLAEEKERQLGIPVVPVFWIAGEDHDFHEVNHLFMPVEQRVDKWSYPEKVKQKKMVSDINLNKEICREWVNNLIENFGETNHTKQLIRFAEEALLKSTTFVDFFANIVMELFKDYGLLIVDSGDSNFRLLQKENFSKQIEHHREVTNNLLEQQSVIGKNGFPITIDSTEKAANIFYCHPKSNERILLEFDLDSNHFEGKSGAVSFSKDELMEIACQDPAKLSNNVVTRPLMQEWLFPTLAFIAGPGEISYWAELKLVFEHFNIKMPPIVPRLNITLLERAIESDLNELQLELTEVLSRGSVEERDRYLESIKDKEVSELFSSLKSRVLKQYELIEAKTNELDKSLLPLLKKNENYLLKQIGFMETKLEESVKSKFDVILSKFNRIDLSLRPDGFPQERVWNIFYYLNQYGTNFIKELMELEFEFNGRHKVIKL